MAHRLAPEARADLDDIAFHVASGSGDLAVAERLLSTITERFFLLSRYPHLGRPRDEDLGAGRRSLAVMGYVIVYRLDDGDVLILRVIRGSRDLEHLFP